MKKNLKKSAMVKIVVKKEIIKSDTDEADDRMLVLCGEVNALGNDDALANTVVKKEITEIKSDTDEVDGRMLALCGEANASGDDGLPKNVVKKEIIEIKSDTDEVDGRMLALCGDANASGDDALSQSALTLTSVKKEIIEIESDTDKADGIMLALCGEVNALRDDTLAMNPKNSALAKTIVKKEIIEIESDTDEDDGRMLVLCGEVNALGNDTLAMNPKNSALAKTIVKKEVIEIESDTDEADAKMLTLCGELNALGDDALAMNPNKSALAKTIVKKEIIEIESDTDEVDAKMLTLCGEVNASGDDALAKNPNKSSVVKTIVKKEIIEIESDTDTDKVGGRMLSLCGADNASRDNTFAKNGKTNRPSMQIVCADDSYSGLVHDLDYQKYLARYNGIGNLYLLEDNVGGSSPMRIMYNEASDRGKARAVKKEKSAVERKAKSPAINSVSKRLKTENGRTDRLLSRAVLRTKETQDTKEDVRHGRKISMAKNTIKLKPTSYVKDTQQKKGDAQRGSKISMAKKNAKLKPTRNTTSQMISRASKRLKTEIGTNDTQRKRREALQGRKVPVTKHNIESESKIHVKDNLHHSFKPRKKENKESLSSMDKCYTCYLASLKTSITTIKSDQQVKPVKDSVSLSDPDIIVVSDHPFPDGGKSPFEATKDGKVIDLEEGIQRDDIFNSSYSKKLIEILRKPYDETEFLKLYDEASLKRPLTRSRQLRDGREIEYNVEDQLALSYLEKYTDFNNKYQHYRNDLPRALNLLRGFFFYLENIVLEGAFKPWLHENHLMNMCFDARGCKIS